VRLQYKIVLIILATLALSLTVLTWFNVEHETRAMTRLHTQGSDLAVAAMVSGIRNVMLAGQGTYAREIVDEIRRDEAVQIAGLKVYNEDGVEVCQYVDFSRLVDQQADSVALDAINGMRSATRHILADQHQIEGKDAQVRTVALRTDSLQNKIGAVRLALDLGPVMRLYGEDLYREATHVPAEALLQGYKAIMLAGKAGHMATYASTSAKLPGVVSVHVFDNQGNKTKIGDTNLPLDQDLFFYLSEALGNARVGYTERSDAAIYTQLLPLENGPRCYPCHGRDHRMRGAIRFSVRTTELDKTHHFLSFTGDIAQAAVVNTISCLLDFGGKDIFVRDYVRGLEQMPEVLEITLFNPDGRRIRLDDVPSLMFNHEDVVRQVLEEVKPVRLTEDRGKSGRYLVDYVPLENDVPCWRCHANDHKVRAVVEMSRSLADIDRQNRSTRIFAAVAGVLTIIVIWLALSILMRYVVVRPVNEMVRVVNEVGKGNLQVRVPVTSRDEIGSLGAKINEMIEALRRRFHLEKSVSRAIVEAVDRAGERGVPPGVMRREAVVVFSSVRGLAPLSERIGPQQLVNVLNAYLRAQAKVVNAHGGQIHRCVGDELVAVFLDDERLDRAANRAVNCAKQIQRILHRLRQTGKVPDLGVGIGINVGPTVMGAIGTEDGTDYVVMGDTVNVGARLCAVAGPGQIVVSKGLRGLLGRQGKHGHLLRPLPPIRFDGTAQPTPVYEVVHDVNAQPAAQGQPEGNGRGYGWLTP